MSGFVKKVAALTLGCKVNAYDTQAMLELFMSKGYTITDFTEKADIYLINTCTVTNLGDKKSRQMIRQAIRKNPEAIIVAAGCYAQVATEEVKKIEGINLVIGTKDRNKIVELVEAYKKEDGAVSRVSNIREERLFENLHVNHLKSRTRAYVKIQEGCDNFCSYCIVPYARGPVRSRPIEDIQEEVESLSQNGFKEIVLTGIQVASYGKDLTSINLLDALKTVHKQDGIMRLRLSSLEPNLITAPFLKALEELPKICDHFHLSLQSGCDTTLQRMNRRYTASEYAKAVSMLRRKYPGLSITTDIIVGFPGEGPEDFEESFRFVREMGFASLHVFPYSAKKGTKAISFPDQVRPEIKQERLNRMLALGSELNRSFLTGFFGQSLPVLFESRLKDFNREAASEETVCYEGHTTNYCKVLCCFKNPENKVINEIIPVHITNLDNTALIGEAYQ